MTPNPTQHDEECRRCEQLQRRVKAFQEGYRDKAFEVTSLEITVMDLRAYGVDKVTARQNESLRTKLLGVCVERNELRDERSTLQSRVAELESALQYIFDHDDECQCDCDNENCCRLQGSSMAGLSVFCPRCIARAALPEKG